MHRPPLIAIALLLTAWLASCCEPATKNSTPVMIDTGFHETFGRDLDILTAQISGASQADSAYYPIYTFAIKNIGTQDDDYTLGIRYNNLGLSAGFDITKHVPAGQTVIFTTPAIPRDSSARYAFPALTNPTDSNVSIDFAYLGIQGQSPDSVEIHFLRPTVTITYGAIDNGPEACNTPASQQTIDVNELPKRY